MFVAVRLLIVAVNAFSTVVKKLDEARLVEVADPMFAEEAVSVVTDVEARLASPVTVIVLKNAVKAFSIDANRLVEDAVPKFAEVAKKLVEVALTNEEEDALRVVIVVVARVEVPNTVKAPELVVDDKSDRNDVFCTQFTPSQYRVPPVTVPDAIDPPDETLIHLVEVPVEDRTIFRVPVAPYESTIP